LESGLLEGKVAGRAAHSLENVRDNIEELLAGNPDKQFGMSFVGGAFDFAQVLQLVSNAAGSPIDEVARRGDVWIEPGTILDE
jgi:hypothetical protein